MDDAPALGAFGLRHLGADSGVAPLLADQAGAGQPPLAGDQETGSAHPVHTGQGVEPFQLEVPGPHISKFSVGGRRRPSTRPLTRPMVGLGLRRGVRHMRSPAWRGLCGVRLGRAGRDGLGIPGGTGGPSRHRPCMIVDQQTQASYTSLQVAENAAKAGDTLSATGTCDGTTEITKNLTITCGATLDGDEAGSVLTIDSGVTVTISSFTITGAPAPSPTSKSPPKAAASTSTEAAP